MVLGACGAGGLWCWGPVVPGACGAGGLWYRGKSGAKHVPEAEGRAGVRLSCPPARAMPPVAWSGAARDAGPLAPHGALQSWL